MQIQGVLKGKKIELKQKPKLPSGSKVWVQITPKLLSLKERKQIIAQLCGAWATDPSLSVIFTEIEKARQGQKPRRVEF